MTADGSPLRVALDLSGPHEPLGNWVDLLADALRRQGLCDTITFATERDRAVAVDRSLGWRRVMAPWWRRSRGWPIDAWLPPVDVVHVAGLATPPTRSTPLLISVDDLRPLRDDRRDRQRVAQLRRAVDQGARLVASSRSAGLEVQAALGLQREQVVSVPPAVAGDVMGGRGESLVVHVTGRTDEFLRRGPDLVALAERRRARVVVLASKEASARLRASGLHVVVRQRSAAAEVLRDARAVVHLSDGARFPSFVISALAAGVPTCATSTAVNRELLSGATALVDERDPDRLLEAVAELWEDESRRAVLIAAGRARATDYSPDVAARSYDALYRNLVREVVRA